MSKMKITGSFVALITPFNNLFQKGMLVGATIGFRF